MSCTAPVPLGVTLTDIVTSYLSSVYPTSQMGLWLKSKAGKSGHHGHNGTTNGTTTGGHNGTHHGLNATLNATHEAAHQNWTIEQINRIPTGVQAVSAMALLISTSLCMVYPVWIIVTIIQAVILFAVILLRIWKIPLTLHCKFSPQINICTKY
jgi:hypothetical protein